MLTDSVPTDPDFKCTLADAYKDPTPQEQAQWERERANMQRKTAQKAKQDLRDSEGMAGVERLRQRNEELIKSMKDADKKFYDSLNLKRR